ncbi:MULTISPECIES: hypothetical protein [Pseudomonas]|uniref:hypothetical protein n=1 Tax=Pseudomonas TaxID=286 RepID=UPI001E2CFABA|nr:MULTISPECIES: hypothetical protein [Pseudomonas]MCD5982971.1 hypothetical protein [Pseudomonas sp. CDFA 610]MCQ9470651.1 hypothetical protein [Pseudomonas alliivorans]
MSSDPKIATRFFNRFEGLFVSKLTSTRLTLRLPLFTSKSPGDRTIGTHSVRTINSRVPLYQTKHSAINV